MITDVSGIKVGHATDVKSATGCTVILCPGRAVAGCDIRGGAPGTRETDLLRPMNLVREVHAILLTGGSAFGLAAADGVMKYLEEEEVGFDTQVAKVPIVPTAVIFDLNLGSSKVRPDAKMGYEACLAAADKVEEGSVGAGTGATIGKIMGEESWMKGGVGTSSLFLGKDLVVGALAVVNAIGDVIEEDGKILAGARASDKSYLDTSKFIKEAKGILGFRENTTLAVVATNAKLSKEEVTKVAQRSQVGFAKAINPAGTMLDGDISFAIATGRIEANLEAVGQAAAEVTADAIRRAVITATSVAGVPALNDL